MLKEQAKLFAFLNRLTDHIILVVSIGSGILIEQIYHSRNLLSVIDEQSFHPFMAPLLLVLYHILFQVYDNSLLYRRTSYTSFFNSILIISLLGLSILITVSFLIKNELFYRTTIIAIVSISFWLLLLKRWFVKYYLENMRTLGRNTRYIVISGSKKRAKRLIAEFANHEEYGYIVSHILDPDLDRVGLNINDNIVKSFSNFNNILMENPVDEIFFAMPPGQVPDFNEKVDFLNSLGINFHIIINLDVFTESINKLDVEPFVDDWYNIPTISFHPTDKKLFKLIIKTYIEFILALGIITLFSPILVIVPIIIKVTSKGPVFFSQKRVGYHGRKFHLLKFRTMVADAENKLDDLMDQNEQSGPVFKISDDPRITSVGKFLRKYSLDELPQLINVLKGDMNLVGPRPPLPSEVIQYKPEWRNRLNMKPGITGLWQVSGRNDIVNFEDWVKLDLEYINTWSLKLDFIIIFKTIPHMIKGSGK